MSMTTLSDPRKLIPSGLGSSGSSGQSFDDGLEHHHHWAREHAAAGRSGPVANAASARTPSTALHDDAHYSVV